MQSGKVWLDLLEEPVTDTGAQVMFIKLVYNQALKKKLKIDEISHLGPTVA
jgi:hypothetical protein